MQNNFESLLQGYLSPDFSIRSQAENQLNALLAKGNPYDLDMLFDSIEKANNNQVKLFISLLIKKVVETCITVQNQQSYCEYINLRKAKIVNIILNIQCEIKTLNILLVALCQLIDLQISNSKTDNINNNPFFIDIFVYIFEFYNYNKNIPNNYTKTFQGLFVLFKVIKYCKEITKDEFEQLYEKFKSFYEQIITDFSNIVTNLFNGTNDVAASEIMLEYLILFLKLFNNSVNFLKSEHRDCIMNLVFSLLHKILTVLFSTEGNIQNPTKRMFDCVFLSNKLLLEYIKNSMKLDVAIVDKYTNLFYVYVSNQQTLEKIIRILKNVDDNKAKLTDYKETKFIINIIDFFKEILQITLYSNWGDLLIFKNCFSDNTIELSDYLNSKFFTTDKVKNILIFAIRNCLTFKVSEIELARSDCEEFYTWYDTLSVCYDLREKAGILCRIIYEKYKKEIRDVYNELENELLNLTQKELALLKSGQYLTFEETNLKCALLSMFDNISVMYFNKKRDYNKWLNQILMCQLDINVINAKGSEIFSKFIIIRLISKIIDFKEIESSKNEIFLKIYNLFIANNINSFHILLNFASVNFFAAFIDDIMPVEFPNNFLQNYIYKICEMLKCTSSPDIHSRIITVTSNILTKFKDEDINHAFPMIFPILTYLWENNWNEYVMNVEGQKEKNLNPTSLHEKYSTINQKNKLCVEIATVRQNLIKLISIFVKRVGFFITFNTISNGVEIKETSVVNEQYFKFIYNIIGFSINVQSQDASFLLPEGFRLILIIQDEFVESSALSMGVQIDELKNPLEQSVYFPYFIKIYDYLNIILENLNASSEYFLTQLFIIEQYVSLSYINCIGSLLDSINFIDKIIFILNKLIDEHLVKYHQILFNIMEYLLFVINSFCSINQNNKNKFNNFIFNFIQNIFNKYTELQVQADIDSQMQKKEELEPFYESDNIIIYLGALQLSNRLIYINTTIYNINSFEFCEQIAKKLLLIYQYKDKASLNISCIEIAVMNNLVQNLENSFNKIGKMTSITELLKTYNKNICRTSYLNRSEEVLDNIMYFYNKMFNKDYYYNLSAQEDKLRLVWSSKLDEINKIDCSDIYYKVKYHLLFLDKMFNYNK